LSVKPRQGKNGPLFVDSSGWIALLSARDANHDSADRLVRSAINQRIKLATSTLVIAEVQRLLLHRVGIQAARRGLEHIVASKHVLIVFTDVKHHESALQWLTKLDDQVITYTDATSFAVMQLENCRAALTFDRDFLIAGFQIWR
jgi:uncharacterized protein